MKLHSLRPGVGISVAPRRRVRVFLDVQRVPGLACSASRKMRASWISLREMPRSAAVGLEFPSGTLALVPARLSPGERNDRRLPVSEQEMPVSRCCGTDLVRAGLIWVCERCGRPARQAA